MNVIDRQRFRLVHDRARQLAAEAVRLAPDGWTVEVKPPSRTLDQNAIFHAICSDIAKARPMWAGIKMEADDWKALLIDGHAKATGGKGSRLLPDLEGRGLVQVRESSAAMNKARATSLIDYCIAWAIGQGITLRERT